MISISGKKWKEKINNQNLVDKLKQDFNFTDTISNLVVSRKFDQTELNSIDNNLNLNNVFLKNSDYEKSINLVVAYSANIHIQQLNKKLTGGVDHLHHGLTTHILTLMGQDPSQAVGMALDRDVECNIRL